jgi:hypothetical protein
MTTVAQANGLLDETFVEWFGIGKQQAASLYGATQVLPINRYSDGSLRSALVSVSMRMPSLTIAQYANIAQPNTPSPLFQTLETQTAPHVFINFGSFGVASLGSAIGHPAVFNANPALRQSGMTSKREGSIMSERVYFVNLSGSSDIYVQFVVQYYAPTNSVRVKWVVHNGWANSSAPNLRIYDATVTVGAFSKTYTNLQHHARTAWYGEAWTDARQEAQLTPNVDAMVDAGALPNTERAAASSVPQNIAGLQITSADGAALPVPFARGAWRDGWASGGEDTVDPWGIVNFPTAVMTQTNGDANAVNATRAMSRMFLRYPMWYRDVNTGKLARPQDFSGYGLPDGSGMWYGTGGAYSYFPASITPAPTEIAWDQEHQGQMTTAAMLDGDPIMVEAAQAYNAANIFGTQVSQRGYDKGIMARGGARGQAWSLRTLFQAALVTPDGTPEASQLSAQIDENINAISLQYQTNPNALGILIDGGKYDVTPGFYSVAEWQYFYHCSVLAYANRANLSVARQSELANLAKIAANFAVGYINTFAQDAQQYTITIGTGDTYPPQFFPNWTAVRTQTLGNNTTPLSVGHPFNNLPSTTLAFTRIAKAQPAIAYAVSLGVPNADEAWARLTQTSTVRGMASDVRYNIVPLARTNSSGLTVGMRICSVQADATGLPGAPAIGVDANGVLHVAP